MLGEQIGEETGQITGMRVLPDEGNGAKVEVSHQQTGTLLGVQVNVMASSSATEVTTPNGWDWS